MELREVGIVRKRRHGKDILSDFGSGFIMPLKVWTNANLPTTSNDKESRGVKRVKCSRLRPIEIIQLGQIDVISGQRSS